MGFTRSPPPRSGLSTVSRHRGHDALASSPRPTLFRAPELRTGSFSRAFTLPTAARASRPDFLSCISSPPLTGCPDPTRSLLQSIDCGEPGIFSAVTRFAFRLDVARDETPALRKFVMRRLTRRASNRTSASGLPLDRSSASPLSPDLYEASLSFLHAAGLATAASLRVRRASSDPTTNRVVVGTLKHPACHVRRESGCGSHSQARKSATSARSRRPSRRSTNASTAHPPGLPTQSPNRCTRTPYTLATACRVATRLRPRFMRIGRVSAIPRSSVRTTDARQPVRPEIYSQPRSTEPMPDDVTTSVGVPSVARESAATSQRSPVRTSGADASATSAPS